MSTATLGFEFEIKTEDGETDVHIDLCGVSLLALIEQFRDSKPNDRSDRDRYFAVAITDLEKVYAYYLAYLAEDEEA
ncbi:MAG: hypothetical protein KDK05_03325 [Candidatus Competibacteraceae bacterium]|nr:hypothetical protein [Candidatus Competibacteraceae bacterium]